MKRNRPEEEERRKMIIFQTFENFCGFMFLGGTAAGIIIFIIGVIIEGICEMKKYTEEEQSLIDGVEYALDNRLDVPEEDIAEYQRLADGEADKSDTWEEYLSNKEFQEYVDRYMRNKTLALSEVLQLKLIQLVAEMYGEK